MLKRKLIIGYRIANVGYVEKEIIRECIKQDQKSTRLGMTGWGGWATGNCN